MKECMCNPYVFVKCYFTMVTYSYALAQLNLNSSPPGQNGCHFADDISKCIFMNAKFCTSIQISLKFVPKGPIDNKSALVQLMLIQFTCDYMRH